MSRSERWFEDYTVGEVIRADGVTISEAEILSFAFTYDPQPFHLDKLAAEQSPYKGLIASGWQTGLLGFRMLLQAGLLGKGSMGSPGLDEIRWAMPVRPGDTLFGRASIEDKRESASKPDRGIVKMKYWIENQKGETVMSFFGTQMVLKKPTA
ncbi:MaoC family dehydratase [Ferrovibrio terrae]|uniref:MaoC family dehydratase n=1 Tax=Ferrovibrio terrae TaxID=2594003 RepID=A0A516H0J2_9PROT|nr:MaoC family dehydratase [Ferrovibrio terrae]QDO97272.1 MaoC family dehydratase [Ferrovibrio terrae]